MTPNDELISLRQRNEQLEAELAYIKDTISQPIANFQRRWGISRGEAAILAALMPGRPISKSWLIDHCTMSHDTGLKNIDVLVCRLRRKIAPITITTLHGTGYHLDAEHVATVKAIGESKS